MRRERIGSIAAIALAVVGAGCVTGKGPLQPNPAANPGAATRAPSSSGGLVFPANETFREKPPLAGPTPRFQQPPMERFTLPQGVDVYLVERHELPTLTMKLVFDVGGIDDAVGKEGEISVCVGLLTEGTVALDRFAFEQAEADLGAHVSGFDSNDTSGLFLSALTRNVDASLDLFTDTLLHPGMRPSEFDHDIKQQLDALASIKGSPEAVVGQVLPGIQWGPTHPMGRPQTVASTKRFTLADCKAFVKSELRPKGARLFVVGDITRTQIEQKLGERLKGWTGSAPAHAALPPPAPRDGRIFFVDVPHSTQSMVSMVENGPTRTASDFFANFIAGQILGGDFSSRINMNLREKHGYTYGADGYFTYARKAGFFYAGGSMRGDVTRESIHEILAEVKRIRDEDVTAAELAREKEGAILGLPAEWATGQEIVAKYERMLYYGLPLDYYDHFNEGVSGVTAAQVRASATAHLAPDALKYLVVGDRETVLPKMKELLASGEIGPGELVELDSEGKKIGK